MKDKVKLKELAEGIKLFAAITPLLNTLNPTKRKIIEYLLFRDKPISILDISKNTKIDYKNTWRYIKQLEKEKVISLTPEGNKIMISIKKLIIPTY